MCEKQQTLHIPCESVPTASTTASTTAGTTAAYCTFNSIEKFDEQRLGEQTAAHLIRHIRRNLSGMQTNSQKRRRIVIEREEKLTWLKVWFLLF